MTRPPRVLFERRESELSRRNAIFSHRPLYRAHRSYNYSRLVNRSEPPAGDRLVPPKLLAVNMKQTTRRKRKSFAMLREAFNGAKKEVFEQSGLFKKIALGFTLGFTIMKEVLGTLSMAPYGIRALRTYQKLESLSLEDSVSLQKYDLEKAKKEKLTNAATSSSNSQIGIIKNLKYGDRERNTLEIYVPLHSEAKKLHPVLVFVHGGVWASGEPWQYAPLAKRCAEEGIVTVLVKYSLYPEVLAEEQAREVSDALSWTMRYIKNYQGDTQKIFLMGMSSGAHICAMALWYRLKMQLLFPRSISELLDLDPPYCFLGLSGVYNITEHYLYEQKRGVASISCMKPANGGLLNFPSMSPALLFKALSIHVNKSKGRGGSSKNDKGKPLKAFAYTLKSGMEIANSSGGDAVIQCEGSGSGVGIASNEGSGTVQTGVEKSVSKVRLNGELSKAASVMKSKERASLGKSIDDDPRSPTQDCKEDAMMETGDSDDIEKNAPSLGGMRVDNSSSNVNLDKTEEDLTNAESSSPIPQQELRSENPTMDGIEGTDGEQNGNANEIHGANVETRDETIATGALEDVSGAKYELLSSLLDRADDWEKVTSIPLNQICPSLIFCSPEDTVVPPATSIELVESLTSLGAKAKNLMYDDLEHADFVCWPERSIEKKSKSYPLISDILNIVSGKVSLQNLDWE